jgi:protein translocase SecG subunit
MQLLVNILPWIQIVLSVFLVAIILLQQSAAGAGGAFGGSDGGAINHTRRGFEKLLFRATIVVAILFVISTFIAILV